MLIQLARQSLWSRRGTAMLTLCSLVISVLLLLGIDHFRLEAKRSFTSTVAGTDLIVGARSSQLNLLLYTVFRIGNATNNIAYPHFELIKQHPQVKWAIPLALGDSHRGFRVLGTDDSYFTHFRYGEQQALSLAEGRAFHQVYETVLGASVAKKLGYQLGQQITLSHGVGQISFSQHKDQPFTVVGILAPTGTPVDQSVHVSLQGIEAIHQGWQQGMPAFKKGSVHLTQEQLAALKPTVLTGVLLGLKSKVATFAVQRQLNEFKAEPLSAILPGAALAELWQMLSMVENLLLLITFMVMLAALVGMTTNLLASQRERSREFAILRAVGARPWQLFILIELEVLLLTSMALFVGFIVLTLCIALAQPYLSSEFGLVIRLWAWHPHTGYGVAAVLLLAMLLGAIPAFASYRQGLSQGLQVRL